MKWISDSKILIVGLGLMGGSYARALTRLGYSVSAIDTKSSTIEYAMREGIVTSGYDYVDEQTVREADAIVFALYPRVFREWIERWQHLFKPGALITDVTGVKRAVVYDIQAILRPDVEFIPSHPMAGREVYGVENSDDKIFRNANFIVTPTEKNTERAIEWCKSLGKLLGFARISTLTPEQHDDAIGFVSQLTHCIAVALMTCNDNTHLADYTGDSFRDLTRIARINDEMWSELFMMNRDALLAQMDQFSRAFTELRDDLENSDVEAMREKMRLSTARRAGFDKK